MKKTASPSKFIRLNAFVFIGVMSLLPFHAFFTTWLGSNTGHLDLIRIWKEVIIVSLVPSLLYVAWSDIKLRNWLKSGLLPKLIMLYAILHLVIGWLAFARGNVTTVALIYALLVNLRFLGFFMLVLVVASKTSVLRSSWKSYVLLPAVIVIIFGLLQLVLPHDFLKHFGYGSSTIPAFQTIDQKLSFRRIQSTLRGANPLGAYMLFVLPLFLLISGKAKRLIAQFCASIVMFFSYSRSAVLGLLVSAAVLAQPLIKWSKKIFISTMVAFCLFVPTVYLLRNNDIAQNTLFHTDEMSQSNISSNASRLGEMKNGLTDIIHEPLGRGPGTAGPASFRNNRPARIADNYFVQIGQEVGVIGVVLFGAILVVVGRALWLNREDELSRVLFALLIGISVVNLVSHAWADDTLSYLYWGLTAVALAPVIMNKERK